MQNLRFLARNSLYLRKQIKTEAYRARHKKVTPREKFDISGTVVIFFLQINNAYRGGFKPHILQISLQYLLAFQKYSYLNFNVHFFKVNK